MTYHVKPEFMLELARQAPARPCFQAPRHKKSGWEARHERRVVVSASAHRGVDYGNDRCARRDETIVRSVRLAP